MRFLQFLLFITSVLSAPLQQTSLLTLRITAPPPSAGGNVQPVIYRELILEEWNDSSSQPIQTWSLPCSLPGLSTETWTEGMLSPRYPWGDQVWFLCRNVPVNSSLNYNPAPVRYMVLNEDGFLTTCIEDFVYPNGTNLLNILPYTDVVQGLNVFYLLGGGATGTGPSSPTRQSIPRIRVETSPCAPADTEGALLGFTQGVTINQLRILDRTLYGTGLFAGASGGIPQPMIYQIGAEGVLPTGTRNPTANIPNFPLVLSSWTDPLSGVWWRTGFNRTAYVALYNNSQAKDNVFILPPSSSGGTLGGTPWRVLTGRQESTEFAVYLTNSSHIVKNTLNGLTNGLPYQAVVQAPPGWRYLSAHARNPSASPSPSPSATPTATSSSSATSTTTSSATASSTSTSSSIPTLSASTSASTSASSYPTSTSTASRNPQLSPETSSSNSPTTSVTPSTTPSNGTIPIPANNNQAPSDTLTPGDQAGIGLGSIAALCVASLVLIHYTPSLRNLWTRQFGSSSKGMRKTTSFRSPVTSMNAPITINHNPQVLVQQRLEHLKDLQKQLSTREVNQPSTNHPMDRLKKEFGPVITGETV